mgnify:CR=1 FL=1
MNIWTHAAFRKKRKQVPVAQRISGRLFRGELPRELEVHMGRANRDYVRGDFAAAVVSLRLLLKLHPALPEAWQTLGRIRADQGRTWDALRCFQYAALKKKNDGGVWLSVSELATAAGDPHAAWMAWRKVMNACCAEEYKAECVLRRAILQVEMREVKKVTKLLQPLVWNPPFSGDMVEHVRSGMAAKLARESAKRNRRKVLQQARKRGGAAAAAACLGRANRDYVRGDFAAAAAAAPAAGGSRSRKSASGSARGGSGSAGGDDEISIEHCNARALEAYVRMLCHNLRLLDAASLMVQPTWRYLRQRGGDSSSGASCCMYSLGSREYLFACAAAHT